MNNKKSTTYLLILIFLLTIGAAVSIGYIIGNSNFVLDQQNNPLLIPTDDSETNLEINQLKSDFNSKIAEKTASYKELEAEKTRVQELLVELEKVKGDANSLMKYKNHYHNLETQMLHLIDEIAVLKNNKKKAVSTIIASRAALNDSKNSSAQANPTKLKLLRQKKETSSSKTPGLAVKNEVPKEDNTTEKINEKEVPELTVTNLETNAYRSRASGKNEISTIANKVDFIRITFTVGSTSNAISEEKKYYIQVINSKNNVLGTKTTENMDGKTLSYSTSKTIQYIGLNIPIVYDLITDKFEKGNYYINVFERTKLVAKTTFNLD